MNGFIGRVINESSLSDLRVEFEKHVCGRPLIQTEPEKGIVSVSGLTFLGDAFTATINSPITRSQNDADKRP